VQAACAVVIVAVDSYWIALAVAGGLVACCSCCQLGAGAKDR
jgi:hypothetical protein